MGGSSEIGNGNRILSGDRIEIGNVSSEIGNVSSEIGNASSEIGNVNRILFAEFGSLVNEIFSVILIIHCILYKRHILSDSKILNRQKSLPIQ